MERFNPFAGTASASSSIVNDDEQDPDPLTMSFNRSSQAQQPNVTNQQLAKRTDSSSGDRFTAKASSPTTSRQQPNTPGKYTTSFPDPFGEHIDTSAADSDQPPTTPRVSMLTSQKSSSAGSGGSASGAANRSNSVTFAPSSYSVDETSISASPTRNASNSMRGSGRQTASGFTSFLSRATSVTSSSVTDRVSGAVDSVRSAVDSISSQIQQAVPSNLNERISATATNLISSSSVVGVGGSSADQPQQSAASYLASKLSSATGQFTSSGQGSSISPVSISRQRVILILDSFANTDWAQQFTNYRRAAAGLGPATAQSALTSFFSSATAQLTASTTGSGSLSANPSLSSPSQGGGSPSGLTSLDGAADSVEQADFRDVSVLANQTTSTATIWVCNRSLSTTSGPISRQSTAKIIRPEYVVVRQRSKNNLDHLRGIVTALNYCLVPTFEPIEIWNIFQDRQMVFAKLLRVQKTLGKENFPLIPQIYCQTHQDLLNYINCSSVILPCLVRTGPLGKGKIRVENLQMLRDFASIVGTSNLSCTIEQYLEVKCDLIVQKLGNNLKLFKRNSNSNSNTDESLQQQQQFTRQSASRQTSIGSSVLSSLISGSSTSQQQHQLARKNSSASSGGPFEKMSDVNVRYRNWVEAIKREFGNKLEAFSVKIVVASNDREYIVGLENCSMDFLGNSENQEEDRRNFVELILNNINNKDNLATSKTHLKGATSSGGRTPDGSSIEPASGLLSNGTGIGIGEVRRSSSEDRAALFASYSGQHSQQHSHQHQSASPFGDKKRFISQTQINGQPYSPLGAKVGSNARAYGQLSSRSQSVSVNQSDYLAGEQATIGKTAFFTRRGSDRSDSFSNDPDDFSSVGGDGGGRVGSSQAIGGSLTSNSGLYQRQASLGQSFLDSTSTAFSSFQRQSLSFFKRLDSRGGGADIISSTPPLSAKSDRVFDRTFAGTSATTTATKTTGRLNSADKIGLNSLSNTAGSTRDGFKSQSVDSSILARSDVGANIQQDRPRRTPPKPPPPQLLGSRQSSLASYSNIQARAGSPTGATTTPNTTPTHARPNLSTLERGDSSTGQSSPTSANQRGRVVRQNSALSAFEPFDPDLVGEDKNCKLDQAGEQSQSTTVASKLSSAAFAAEKPQRILEPTKRAATNFDSASITSGDSNSTGETTTAEDTMNNLKKTFASIFGDKCD